MLGSTLWATPAAPNRWFDAELIERSRAYHEPLERAAVGRFALQVAGLAVALLTVRLAIEPVGSPGVRSSLFAGAVVGLLLWLPRLVVDSWMEFRHEPRFGRGGTIPVGRFAAVSAVGMLAAVGLGALAAVVVHVAATATPWWPPVVMLGAGGFMAISGPVAARLAYRSDPLEPVIAAELALVGAAGGVPEVTWGRMVSPSESGMNALSLSGVGVPRVLCTDELVDGDHDLRDFVVAHEVGHLRRGHHRRAFIASLVGLSVEIGTLWLADQWILQRSGEGLVDPRSWPLAVAVIATTAIPVGMVEAWQSRSHERQADLDAIATVGLPRLDALRSLHEHTCSDLDPGVLARLFGPHPTPAERILRAERHATAR